MICYQHVDSVGADSYGTVSSYRDFSGRRKKDEPCHRAIAAGNGIQLLTKITEREIAGRQRCEAGDPILRIRPISRIRAGPEKNVGRCVVSHIIHDQLRGAFPEIAISLRWNVSGPKG